MGDENAIRTLRDYSKPSHEGYRNGIELPVWNNVVPLRSDTIRLVQNGCSFHELWSEDPNQHLKDFLKLVDSLDLNGENKERTLQRLMEAHLAPTQPTQVKKSLPHVRSVVVHTILGIAWKILNKPFIEYASSYTDKARVLGKPFIDISNKTYDPPERVVRFTNRTDEIAYKMPHKIEQYNSLSDLEKEHTKSVYLRNEEDKRRGVEYVMSKILGFYKECLELGPEYVTWMDDEGEVTLYLTRRSLEDLRMFSLDDSWRMI
uniref:Zinc finger, CCHC-type n=1 Tax=Tanacetum cinerariifolium TaxID=118510 RepID=A0A6L2LFR1_TANCI|nr:zinc finger, CCHC-type [Tanacetum cinerariifolium]